MALRATAEVVHNAEMNILCGLESYDLLMSSGCYMDTVPGCFWCPDRGPEDVPKCKRYDHIFASASLNPTACWAFPHDLRGRG